MLFRSMLVATNLAIVVGCLYLGVVGLIDRQVHLPYRGLTMVTAQNNPIIFWLSEMFWIYGPLHVIAVSKGKVRLLYAKIVGIPNTTVETDARNSSARRSP